MTHHVTKSSFSPFNFPGKRFYLVSYGVHRNQHAKTHRSIPVLFNLDLYVTKYDISWKFSVVWFSKGDYFTIKIRQNMKQVLSYEKGTKQVLFCSFSRKVQQNRYYSFEQPYFHGFLRICRFHGRSPIFMAHCEAWYEIIPNLILS